MKPAVERFWSRVNRNPEGCWTWKGTPSSNGYGNFSVAGKQIQAHRYSYELHFGSIPFGLKVCHTCDNKPCVRPDHLFAGTQKQNLEDCTAKGRMNGELRYNHILTDDKVLEIRRRRAAGEKGRSLAQEFGVHEVVVSEIHHRKKWKHL